MWDDAQGYPPRKLFGFYSKSSLQNLVTFQRLHKKDLDGLSSNPDIAGRIYQVETIKRVTETFTGKRRKALIVSHRYGKTRVAIALSELLVRVGKKSAVLVVVVG